MVRTEVAQSKAFEFIRIAQAIQIHVQHDTTIALVRHHQRIAGTAKRTSQTPGMQQAARQAGVSRTGTTSQANNPPDRRSVVQVTSAYNGESMWCRNIEKKK